MLPSLIDLGIEPGSFIRKLDKQTDWNGYTDESDLSIASKFVSEKVFKEQGAAKYSLWPVSTEQEFYGVVASLTAIATPKDRNIDFVWIAKSELEEVGIVFEQVPEGKCLHVQFLHYDAVINANVAQQLCYNLMSRKRAAKRCKKAQTSLILEHQKTLGCKGTDVVCQVCECERWS
jgi:hypothetical protein